MRAFFRLAASTISFVFLALLVLTTETAAEELGLVSKVRAFVRGGWQAVTDSGYVMAVHAGFWLSLGIAATLWIDHFIRKSRQGAKGRSIASFDLLAEKDRQVFDSFRLDHASVTETSTGTFMLDMLFSDRKKLYITSLKADGDCMWHEVVRSDKFLRIEVEPAPNTNITALSVVARPFDLGDDAYIMQEGERQQSLLEKRFSVLHSRGVARPLQWQPNTASGKPQ